MIEFPFTDILLYLNQMLTVPCAADNKLLELFIFI